MALRSKTKKYRFNRMLFRWHKKNYRPMRWRTTRDPYKILVSEIMLQQTQVSRVRKKYKDFLQRFPTIFALAEAPLGDVLRLWSGLGYNRRAKYLQECAKMIMKNEKGRFPRERERLLALPGVGPSTAAAIRTFAFGEDEPMIDTNLRRILTRVFFYGKRVSDRELYSLAKSCIPKGKGREWNYAMLDLAALSCTARSHDPFCPLTPLHGEVLPQKQKPKQGTFPGSKRYLRGKIMKAIIANHRVSVAEIKKLKGDFPFDPRTVADELVGESMLGKSEDTYVLL